MGTGFSRRVPATESTLVNEVDGGNAFLPSVRTSLITPPLRACEYLPAYKAANIYVPIRHLMLARACPEFIPGCCLPDSQQGSVCLLACLPGGRNAV